MLYKTDAVLDDFGFAVFGFDFALAFGYDLQRILSQPQQRVQKMAQQMAQKQKKRAQKMAQQKQKH